MPIINNKPMLCISIMLLLIIMVLSFPFPHQYPFGEVIFTTFKIPTHFANGLQTIGMVSLFLLIISLYLLANAMEKHRVRIVVIAILILVFVPALTVNLFQKTFATGIYAVSYEDGHCTFDMINEDTLHGECELSLKNNSNDNLHFNVTFEDINNTFEDDDPMVSLMNHQAPYQVTLDKKGRRHVQIEMDIDVSDMINPIEHLDVSDVDILIESEGKARHL